LNCISLRLQQGEAYQFDSTEVQRMHSVARALATQPSSVAYKVLFRFFAPALALLVVLWGIYLWFRLSR
jgi:hypothetical protein